MPRKNLNSKKLQHDKKKGEKSKRFNISSSRKKAKHDQYTEQRMITVNLNWKKSPIQFMECFLKNPASKLAAAMAYSKLKKYQ